LGETGEVVDGGESGELLDGRSQALVSTSGWIPWQAFATGSRRGRDNEPGDAKFRGEEIEAVPSLLIALRT
jgi:hypothetical protein